MKKVAEPVSTILKIITEKNAVKPECVSGCFKISPYHQDEYVYATRFDIGYNFWHVIIIYNKLFELCSINLTRSISSSDIRSTLVESPHLYKIDPCKWYGSLCDELLREV